MRFSQRIGKTPTAKLVQRESIDEELRNSLWSSLTVIYWNSYRAPGNDYMNRNDYVQGSNLEHLVLRLWLHFFKQPIDTVDEYWEHCLDRLRKRYFKAPWYEVLDFVEFVAENGPEDAKKPFIEMSNTFLERENSAYRFVNETITEITSQAEIDEVETAIQAATPYAGVRTHLVSALALMSDRENPDYRNSIKESISAVESLAKQVSGESTATLGAVLKSLERDQKLHPALKSAFSSLYGYTNVSVRRTHLDLGAAGDNDRVHEANSWTRWKLNGVVGAGGMAQS
jgi:AbiJ N-terminal domain 4